MIQKIPFKFAVNSLLVLINLALLFHVCVLLHIIPFNIVWGGSAKSYEDIFGPEFVSISILLLVLLIVAIRANYIPIPLAPKFTQVILWIFTLMFILNTVGNLFSKNMLETLIFTPITLISAVLCYRLICEK